MSVISTDWPLRPQRRKTCNLQALHVCDNVRGNAVTDSFAVDGNLSYLHLAQSGNLTSRSMPNGGNTEQTITQANNYDKIQIHVNCGYGSFRAK